MNFKEILQKCFVWKSYRNLNLYLPDQLHYSHPHTGANKSQKSWLHKPILVNLIYVGRLLEPLQKHNRQISSDQQLTKYFSATGISSLHMTLPRCFPTTLQVETILLLNCILHRNRNYNPKLISICLLVFMSLCLS